MNVRRLLLILGLLGAAALTAWLLRPPASSPTPIEQPDPADVSPVRNTASTADSSTSSHAILPSSSGKPAAKEPAQEAGTTLLLGSVVAPIQATLGVRMPMRIREVLAREGDFVRSGQLLIDLDDTDLVTQERTASAGAEAARAQVQKARAGWSAQKVKADSDVDTARAAVKQAQTKVQQATLARQAAESEQQADLQTAREGVRKAEAALDHARETLKGLEELSAVGGVSRSDLEGARVQQRVAQADLDTARAQVERLQAGSGGQSYRVALAQKDVDAAQAGLLQARDGLRTAEEARRQSLSVAEQDVRAVRAALDQAIAGATGARAARGQTRLASPITGLVTSIAAHAGDIAQPGTPLATIVSLTNLRVDALVPSRLLAAFHAGQRARISVDTAPGRAFTAFVSEIARIAEPDGRTFRVKFRLSDTPPLRPGQTARITVLAGS